jgi:hypothetical protein
MLTHTMSAKQIITGKILIYCIENSLIFSKNNELGVKIA